MEAAITFLYHVSPREQLQMTSAQWLNLWYQIPRLRAEHDMSLANTMMYTVTDGEGRNRMWSRWQSIIEEFVAVGKFKSVRAMVNNVRRMLARAGITG